MKICIIGLGYIGLPTAAMFSNHGCEVIGVDVNSKIVDALNRGEIFIEEPGLAELLHKALEQGNFRASLSPEAADAFIIAVPTPKLDDDFLGCDLSYVLAGAKSILTYLQPGNVVIIESTVAPTTTDEYIKPIIESSGLTVGDNIFLAHCPERVLPGKILHELINNNRIIGGITPACAEAAAKVYGIIVKGEMVKTEAKTAELSKCMENAFRDVNIALANELAKICYNLDINCLDVIEMANKHPRVNIHQPGPGVGGHCLAIDPYFIYAKAPETAHIIKLARDTNRSMPGFVVEITEKLIENINNPKIAAFGVAYKGNVGDMRESPAMEVVNLLLDKGYSVSVFDPFVKDSRFTTLTHAVDQADIILVLTDHDEFKTLDHRSLASQMKHPVLFDTKNIVKPQVNSGLEIINFGNIYQYKESGRQTR